MLALLLLACSPATTADPSSEAGWDQGKDARFDQLVEWTEQSMAEWGVPGAALGMIVQGEGLRAGLGVRRVQTGEPVTPATRFRVASLSKMLTGMAFSQQVEEGRLDPDAPASDALPGLSFADPAALSSITLLDLMSHQSGLQAYGLPSSCDEAFEQMAPILEERAASWNLWSAPGEHSIYSNAGVSTVGLAVQLATGLSFPEYMTSNVLEPAGMAGASYDPNVASLGEYATGHSFDMAGDGRLVAERDLFQRACAAANPASGLIANLDEMLALAQLLLDEGAPVLSPEGWERMTRTGYGDPEGSIYGWGIQAGSYRDHRVLTHTGSLHGYQSILYVLPEDGLALVVMLNSDHGTTLVPEPWYKPTNRIAERALNLFLGLEPQERSSSVRAVEDWGRYVGTYQDAFDWGEQVVSLEEGGLVITSTEDGQRFELVPYSQDRFQYSYLSSEGLTYWQSIDFKQEDERTRWLLSTDGLAERRTD